MDLIPVSDPRLARVGESDGSDVAVSWAWFHAHTDEPATVDSP